MRLRPKRKEVDWEEELLWAGALGARISLEMEGRRMKVPGLPLVERDPAG